MESIEEVLERTAKFTSSQIYKLMTNGRSKGIFGAKYYEYINEKAMESVLGRGVETEVRADSLSWGNLCESIAFDLLPLEYSLVSKKRYSHLDYCWSGMPDTITDDKVGDIKCPWTLKSFMQLATTTDLKKDKPEYFWQLVSNAILCNKKEAELFVFMPKYCRINEIIKEAEKVDSPIKYKSANQLPWLPENTNIPEVITNKVTITDKDKQALIDRVKQASLDLEVKIQEYKSLLPC